MVKSNTKIGRQVERKQNPELVETIILAKKNKDWHKVAEILSGPRRKRADLNLEEIDKETKDGETVIVTGKVLSGGELDKKIKIVALSFSEKAKEKLLKSKIKPLSIVEEIKQNPEAKGVKILKGK